MKRTMSVLAWGLAAVFLVAGDAHADPEGLPCAPEPTDELIEYGDLRICSISPVGESDVFRFVGALNEIVRIVGVEGSIVGPDVCVELRKPGGGVVLTQCGEVSTVLEVALAPAGEYTIRVFEAGNDQVMNYNVVLERVFPASPTSTPLENGISLAGEMISPRGDLDLYVFQGAVGDLIRIDAVEGSIVGPDVCVNLRRPDGSVVDSTCGEVSVALEATLDQNGPYTLILTEAGNDDAMNANLLYSCLFGPCLTLIRPICGIDLNQGVFFIGDVVTADTLRIATTSEVVDLKFWLTAPGFPPLPWASAPIPALYDQNFGPLPLFTVEETFPVGIWEFNCRMTSIVTGETLVLDQNPFEVR
jgi:hypothetical protein